MQVALFPGPKRRRGKGLFSAFLLLFGPGNRTTMQVTSSSLSFSKEGRKTVTMVMARDITGRTFFVAGPRWLRGWCQVT